ncbi:hypothetical protein A7A09_008325 [Paracoccus methylarcula]|uniref:Uncharacterized protein n=1 Tax=Paracoccus methylarcula TaxID=72022 RepID=A0A422QYP6_9RHOB|nr:hypothetical protein A7A09_008325 [Paracoccus methylarcula]
MQFLSGRRKLLILALIVIGAGAAFNWSWLTAVGAAPLILSLAPCAIMCAAGFCMMCRSKSCATGSKSCCADSNPASEAGATRD